MIHTEDIFISYWFLYVKRFICCTR